MAIAQYGSALDEMFWTPLRDLQVLGKKIFNSGFGPGHSALSIASLVTGVVGSLPFVFKVFNENEVNTLHDVLQNCEAEFNQSFFKSRPPSKLKARHKPRLIGAVKKSLTEDLKKHLKKEGIFDIDPVIVAKTRRKKFPPFRKETYWDVEYSFSEGLNYLLGPECSHLHFTELVQKIFNHNSPEDLPAFLCQALHIEPVESSLPQALKAILYKLQHGKKEERQALEEAINDQGLTPEKIAAFSRILPLFFSEDDQKCNLTITIQESHQQFIDNIDKISLKKVAGGIGSETYNFLNDSAVHFWLAFVAVDVFKSQGDTSQWNLKEQLWVVGIGIGFGLIKGILSTVDFLKGKCSNFFRNKEQDAKPTQIPAQPLAHVGTSLKHRQLEYLFIQQQTRYLKTQSRKRKSLVMAPEDIQSEVEKIFSPGAATEVETSPSRGKKLKGFFTEHDSVKAHIQTIEAYLDSKQVEAASAAAEIAAKGVSVNFIQWFAGAAIAAGGLWLGAKSTLLQVGAFLNEGLQGLSLLLDLLR